MRRCPINDCTGFVDLAPCCLDCPERDVCPDRCPSSKEKFGVGVVIDDRDDSKRVFNQIQGRSEGI